MSPGKKNKGLTRFSDPADIDLQVEKARGQIEVLRKQQVELEQEKAELEDLRIKYSELIAGKKGLTVSLSNAIAILEAEEKDAGRLHELASETRKQFIDFLADISTIREDILDGEDVSEQIGRGLILINRAGRALNKAGGKIEALSGRTEAEDLTAGAEARPERGGGSTSFADAVRFGFGLAVPGLILAIIILVLARLLLR